MSRVSASAVVAGDAAAAERLWLDTTRWASFVDGFDHVVRVEGAWPSAGTLIWASTPHGRGRVVERVAEHRPGERHVADVEDVRLTGTQRVTFEPARRGGTRVTVRLEYRLKQRTPLGPLSDFFVRRSLADALLRTVRRFEIERRAG